VLLDGTEPGAALRSPEVNATESTVAAVPAVRELLVGLQRSLVGVGGIVVEGRDIGTVVAPDAEVKVYLVAEPDVRARRRLSERPEIGADALATDLRLRDQRDAIRMQPAADATTIDTTDLDIDDVVAHIEALVRARTAAC
jgi:cytidylate kinase